MTLSKWPWNDLQRSLRLSPIICQLVYKFLFVDNCNRLPKSRGFQDIDHSVVYRSDLKWPFKVIVGHQRWACWLSRWVTESILYSGVVSQDNRLKGTALCVHYRPTSRRCKRFADWHAERLIIFNHRRFFSFLLEDRTLFSLQFTRGRCVQRSWRRLSMISSQPIMERRAASKNRPGPSETEATVVWLSKYKRQPEPAAPLALLLHR